MRNILFVSVVLMIFSGVTFSMIYDDFEDGDFTNNPTWTVVNDAGEASIAEDPIHPDNNVLKIHGSNSAHHMLETSLVNSVSWTEFDFSMDYLSSDDNYHPRWSLITESGALTGRLYRENGSPYVVVTILDSSGVQYDHTELYLPSPIDDWWRMHMWYDTDTDLINFDIRIINTNDVLHTTAFAPSAYLSSIPDITAMGIYFEETSWQYADNVMLIPEPATLSLLALGILVIRKRKA